MVEVYIFEDDYIFQNKILAIINDYNNPKDHKGIYNRIKVVEHKHLEVLDEIQVRGSQQPCLFIIDVDLKKSYTGFDLAKRIRAFDHLSNIIFVTSHIELMSNVFLLNLKVMSYIYKLDPLLEDRLTSSLEAIEKEIVSIQISNRQTDLVNEYFTFSDKNTFYKVTLSSIIALEMDSIKRKVKIITVDQTYECRKTLKEILSDLPNVFMKSHRAIVLNMDHVVEVKLDDTYYEAVMTNGEAYSISRNYVKDIINTFANNK